MTPKPKEEINKIIGDISSLSYESLPEDYLESSSAVGSFDASYNDLVRIFGDPIKSDWSWKTTFEWFIKDKNGRIFRIYDWKTSEWANIEFDDNDSIDEMKNKTRKYIKEQDSFHWMIGGISTDGVSDLKRYILYHTLNESIRDKMTPPSEEKILKNLDADPNVSYKKTKRSDVGTYLIGEYDTTYDTLVKLFGKPKKEDWIGNNFVWNLLANNGHLVTIYDNNFGLDAGELKKRTYRWHIGGTDPQDANNLIAYIIRNSKDINESIINKMLPISKEEIKKLFEDKPYIYIIKKIKDYKLNIDDIFTEEEISDMYDKSKNDISYIDEDDNMVVVFEDRIKEVLGNVGEGIEHIDSDGREIYPSEYQNEVFVDYYEHAWGGIDIDEWNNLGIKLKTMVGKNGLEDFDIDTNNYRLTLIFDSDYELDVY